MFVTVKVEEFKSDKLNIKDIDFFIRTLYHFDITFLFIFKVV